MKRGEIARLLGLAAAFDRRTVGDADVQAWHAVLADLEFSEAEAALREHFSETTSYLMPADIRQRVRAARRRAAELRDAEAVRRALAAPRPSAETAARGKALVSAALEEARRRREERQP